MTKRKTKKPGKRITRKAKKVTLWGSYVHSREKFFQDHPNVRVLLALFVVSFVLYMAIMFSQIY